MNAQSGANNGRRWVSIDQLLSAIENDRVIDLPARPKPVNPASDEECYRLNPPDTCTSPIRRVGLPQAVGMRASSKPRT